MCIIDKILLMEADSVSDAEYEELTGSSIASFRERMRQQIAKTKREVEAERRKGLDETL